MTERPPRTRSRGSRRRPRRRRAVGVACLALIGGFVFTDQASARGSQNAADMVVINPGGGQLPDGSDGVQAVFNGNSGFKPGGGSGPSFAVPVDGSDQQFFANTGQWCCGGVGPQINIDGKLIGEAGAAYNSNAESWGATGSVQILETTGSAMRAPTGTDTLASTPTGSGTARIRYTTVQGGLTYVVDRDVSYTYPNAFYAETYTVTIPAGNTAPVKLYVGGDAAPGDSDSGRGVEVTAPYRTLYEVNESSGVFVAYGEVEGGSPFTAWWVGSYSSPYSDINAGNDLASTVDPNRHDAGMDVQWTLPSAPGTYTRSQRTIVNFQSTSVTAGFPTASATAGEATPLEFEVINTKFTAASGLGFSFTLPAGLGVAGAAANTCGGTAAVAGSTVTLSGATVGAAANCTLSVPVTGATGSYTVDEQDLTVTGLTKGFGTSTLTLTSPPSPPAPAEPPVQPAPTQPAPSVKRPAVLLKPVKGRSATGKGTRSGKRGQTRMVARVKLNDRGRYTFIYVNRRTGKRLIQQPGSGLGKRTLKQRFNAPVLRNQKAGRRIVLRTYFARKAITPKASNVLLRIIREAPDGTLSEVRLDSRGRLIG